MSTDQSYAGGRALFAQAMTADFPWPVTRGVTPGSESGAMPRGARTEVAIRVKALSNVLESAAEAVGAIRRR
jgi:hypothetical protein